MREFGLIHTRFWDWVTQHSLKDSEKVLAAYILSNRHGNSLGCYKLPQAYAAEDLKYGIDTVSKGYFQLEKLGFIAYCSASKFVLIRKYLQFNPIQNSKHAKGIVNIIQKDIPGSFTLLDSLMESLQVYGGAYLTDEMRDTLYHTLYHRVSDEYRYGYAYTDTDTDTDTSTNPVAEKLSHHLANLITQNNSKAKTNPKTWVKDIDKMLRIDNRSEDEVCQVIEFSQRDPFWQANILSGKKLREKFDQLWIKMGKAQPHKPDKQYCPKCNRGVPKNATKCEICGEVWE